ncbi:MAG TPA: HD domain-containing phosphohydrolase [Planctomycetota bacterium]|nr:HD domain-containing phosphohydrolase [Planctomycetota bacterium]
MSDGPAPFIKTFIMSLAHALGLINRRIGKHHQRVTHICLNLSRALELSNEENTSLFYAGLLHDIGAFSSKDKLEIMEFDFPNCYQHCEAGYRILQKSELMRPIAESIRYHHDKYSGPNNSGLVKDAIPLLSQIIHISDRFEVLIQDDRDILPQSSQIVNKIVQCKETWFSPKLVEVLQEVTASKIFWVGLMPEFVDDILNEFSPQDDRKLTVDNMVEMAYIFAQVVDYKSHFTKLHSAQVAENAIKIGKALGWSKLELKHLLIAGLLHDLGKLATPDEILEKPGALTPNEYDIIKMHPYFTYLILSTIPGFDEVSQWAIYHHERMDGKGYPLEVDADNIPQGARIIAVADRFTALD